MIKKWTLAIMAAGCMVLASCNKDDETPAEEVVATASDRVTAGLFGNVKTITIIGYLATLIDGTIVKGDALGRRVTEFNNGGWVTFKAAYNMNLAKALVKSATREYVYDSMNRVIKYTDKWYNDNGETVKDIYERTTVYDDVAKTATETDRYSVDGGKNWSESNFIDVYPLNDYGQKVKPSGGDYDSKSILADVKYAYKYVIKTKDDKGNPTLTYRESYTDDVLEDVSDYAEFIYTYY